MVARAVDQDGAVGGAGHRRCGDAGDVDAVHVGAERIVVVRGIEGRAGRRALDVGVALLHHQRLNLRQEVGGSAGKDERGEGEKDSGGNWEGGVSADSWDHFFSYVIKLRDSTMLVASPLSVNSASCPFR